ncbi:MAG: MarR family winged helix-turn-helix transcriptional regulator [Corynebacterium sp.]|nr:MarR family winged helix-turn-helix transcriptional regulator [Corynebacterium sp.]
MRPVSQVTAAIADGASTPGEIAAATALEPATVTAILEQLERIGYLQAQHDAMACDSCGLHCGGSSQAHCGGLRTLSLQMPEQRKC